MQWFFFLISCLLTLALTSCDAMGPQASIATATSVAEGQDERTPVTTSSQAPGTRAGLRECPTTSAEDLSYTSPDGKLWTSSIEFGEPGRVKILWRKPVGTHLEISGRRLDGEAPPLGVQFSGGGPDEAIQPSALVFPTPGCWEVMARTDESTLRLVLEIKPSAIRPLPTPGP